ncbi:polysaccharide deacetylase family protein, partial [Pedobacter aquatilis]|uniref:polysaccharide deacetylase family protein n=1 Tax=Pedobacter aquatilis TaxID=351343 RepID=UPI00292E0102
MEQKQIFQSNTKSRWLTFIWTSRSLIIALIIALGCVVYTISSIQSPALPYFHSNTPLTGKALSRLKKSQQYRDFKIQKSKLEQIKKDKDSRTLVHTDDKRLNLAFYVSWTASKTNSLADLRKNISHLDMVATESFFIRPDSIFAQIDTAALNIIHRAGKKSLAMVSNYNTDHWDGDVVRKMLSNETSQQKFITELKALVTKNGFSGINIDFEELNLEQPSLFLAFMDRLYGQFHHSGLMVTQDISPENDDYNAKELAKYNDYLILMAYDQHTEQSNAGDIANQEWVEEKLDNICELIDPKKVILALACYGYDWPENSVGSSVTYEETIITANANKSKVYFDTESANLNYRYNDANGIRHSVHFTDAATYYNLIRKADDWGVAGIALWRLGSEDKRIWTFINTNLSLESMKKTPFDLRKLAKPIMNGIAYIGDGEILDLIATPAPGSVRFTIDRIDRSILSEDYLRLPSQYVIKRFGEADKKIALTFDDGPDPVYTPQVMDVLAKNKVPGCFFVVGLMAEKNMELLRRQYNQGYEIGNHTFFHPDMSTIGPERVSFELNATRRLIECVTGHSTILFRAPFNADAEPQNLSEILPVAQSRRENYVNIGEFIDPQDWQPGKTSDQIFNEVVKQYDNGNILLLHDAGGNRQATVDALPRIIDFYKKKGYTFVSVGELMGKKKAEVMPLASSLASKGLVGSTDYFFISFFYYANIVLDVVFTTAIVMAILRTILIA